MKFFSYQKIFIGLVCKAIYILWVVFGIQYEATSMIFVISEPQSVFSIIDKQ